MLCPDCHTYVTDDLQVCPQCGKLLIPVEDDEEELMRFRQGRHLRKAEEELPPPPITPGSTGASRSFEDVQPRQSAQDTGAYYARQDSLQNTGRIYGDELDELDMPLQYGMNGAPQIMTRRRRARSRRRKRRELFINWVYVCIAAVILLFGAVVGTFVYLQNTESGQVIMARLGQDATSAAMWTVGDEYMRTGDIERSIAYYTLAREKDTEAKTPNLTGLLKLGSAYEAVAQLDMAEEVYAYIYTDVAPESSDAYRSQVRVLLAQDRGAEAAVLLKTAYEKTGVTGFRSQRLEILPEIPNTSVVPGYYTAAQSVALIQDQEHDVYYSLDPFAQLPEAGILYEGPIELGEGEHELRAVAVNGDLISDPMKVAFQIYLPTPLQPDANLAPNTYTSKRTVKLRPGKLEEEELEKNPGYAATLDDPVAQTITIYYTIDGSQPDQDSPIFTGEAITLPTGGYVTLKAVSVNGYGKQGNTLNVQYKIDCKPYFKKVYSTADTIDGMKLNATTREAFWGKYGNGTGPEMVTLDTVEGELERYTYPWGYASFMKIKSGWVLADLMFTTGEITGPRDTKIGMTETQITEKFKDFGQVVGNTGVKRGLYYVEEDEQGAVSILPTGERTIYYRTDTAEGHMWQLEYQLGTDGKCKSIRWFFQR